MNLQVPPELEAKLARLAAESGRTADQVATDLWASGECPECGAAEAPLTCRERLELLLAWEVDDEALRARHFLTVASYNLQHPAAFTEEARAGLEEALDGYLAGRLTIADIRRRASRVARVHRPTAEVCPQRRDWSMTIDVVAAPGKHADAATRVLAWAESIRRSRRPIRSEQDASRRQE